MKTGAKTLAIVLLFVGLVLVNYLASSVPVRLDATADSIYSLSSGTRAMLGKIEEPVTLSLYFTKDASGLPIMYKSYAARVQEMLRQYVRAAHGKITLKIVNPSADTPEEEAATAAGLTAQVSPQGGDQFFFGLVATQADQQKTIEAFTPQREQFLEYDLSKLIYSVQQIDKRKLGLLTSLPLQGSSQQEMQMMMMMRQQPQQGQMVSEEWADTFEIVKIDPAANELPANIDVLAVIHPTNLSNKLQYAIDQFLLAGKPVFLAVDPVSQYFKRQGGQQAMMGGPTPNVASDLPQLLGAWGIAYDAQKVVGDLDNATPLQNPQTREVSRYATWINLHKENLSPQSLTTAQLNSILFVEAGSVAAKPGSGLTFTPLIETSAQTGDLPTAMLQMAQSDDIAKQIKPDGKKTIAALVTGKFKSAFPDGAPKEEEKKDDPAKPADKKDEKKPEAPAAPGLKESKGNSTLFVVADTDWLFDDYSVRKMNFFGQTAAEPINDNLSLADNAMEFLGGSQDLITIRGKGSAIRQFTVVRKMEADAQKKYQAKLTELDGRLQKVQAQLSELQGKKTEGNRIVASPEVAKAIEDFQKQSAKMRGERREIRHDLQSGIYALKTRLVLVNLLVSPLLVGVFGLMFYNRRRRA